MTDFYIDPGPDGDNSNNGTSKSTPWKDWDAVTTYQSGTGFNPGDRILIIENGACRFTLDAPTSGSSSSPITIGAYNANDIPIKKTKRPIILGSDQAGGFIVDQAVGNIFQNPGFEGTWSGSPPAPANWIVTNTSTSQTTEETTRVYIGSKAVHIHFNGNPAQPTSIQQQGIALTNEMTYRIAVYHEEPGNADLQLGVMIIAMWGGTPYYYKPDGTWTLIKTSHYLEHRESYKEGPGYVEFVAPDSAPSEYRIVFHGKDEVGDSPAGDYYIDAAIFGKRAIAQANDFPDPYFKQLISNALDADFWETIENGNATVGLIEDDRYGTYPYLEMDDLDSEVAVQSKAVTLKNADTYLFGIRHHEEEFLGQNTAAISVQIRRQTNPITYWDPNSSSFVELGSHSNQGDAISEHTFDWKKKFIEFDTPGSGIQDYKIYIGRRAGTADEYERIFFDEISIVEKNIDKEVYFAFFHLAPQHVYVTGYVRGVYVTNYQLTEDSAMTGHPNLNCWQYDNTNKILYINIGGDPEGAEVECAVRERNVDFAGESYITIENLIGKKAYGDGIDLKYTDSTRATGLKVLNCAVHDVGKLGICIGYHPPDPTPGGSGPTDDKLTPANITIEDTDVIRFNRVDQGFINLASGFYRTPNGGIRLFPGDDALAGDGDEIGNVIIRRCRVVGDYPLLNYGGFRNGIHITLGNNVVIEKCEVTKVLDHGVIVVGTSVDYTTGPWAQTDIGDVRAFVIKHNHIHHCGDDLIWPWGVQTYGNKICYNILHDTRDNGIDVNEALTVEIYNNTLYNCFNEMIAIRNLNAVFRASIYAFNNIFIHWGEYWRNEDSKAAMAYGVAVGFVLPRNEEIYSVVDHNTFYALHSSAVTSTKPYCWIPSGTNRVQKTLAEAQVYGFDKHGKTEDPKLQDPTGGDLTLRHDSPCIDDGYPLDEMRTLGPLADAGIYFDNADAIKQILDPDSVWAGGVQTVDQEAIGLTTAWDKGAFAQITEKPVITFRKAGTPSVDLTPIFEAYRSVTGQEFTPEPTIYEIGSGGYAFATRIMQRTFVVVDSGDVTMHDADRYKMFILDPDENYLRLLREKAPVGQMAEEDTWQAIKERTDNLPDDPADQSLVEAAVTAATANLDAAVSSRAPEAGGNVESIKQKTDQLNFTGSDVKSTLDGEAVTTDAPSREASKADISSLALEATAQGIKGQTDKMGFNGADIKATLDGEEVTTDSASREASKADVSELALEATVQAIQTLVAAVKVVTDQMNIIAGDVRATLAGEEVITDSASREASKADISALALQATLNAVGNVAQAVDNRLPANPADQSSITTQLGNLQSNLQGAGGKSLKTLSDEIGTRSSHSAADAGAAAASEILTTPANKLATDASGRVTAVLANPIGIRRNSDIPNFRYFLLGTNGKLKAGATNLTAQRALDDGAFEDMENTPVEVSNGVYRIDIDQLDSDALTGTWKFSGDSCMDTIINFKTET